MTSKIRRGRPAADAHVHYIGLMGEHLRMAGLRDLPIVVSKVAWDDLKDRNHLDLDGVVGLATTADVDAAHVRGRPVSATSSRRAPSIPLFTDPVGRHCYLLSQVAARCVDPSMGNLLAFIADERPRLRGNGAGRALAQIFDIIAGKAFRAAGVHPDALGLRAQRPANVSEMARLCA